MLFGVYFYKKVKGPFTEELWQRDLDNLDLVFSLEKVIKTKKGVGTSVLKGVIQSVLTTLAFNKFCILQSPVFKNGIPP